MKSTHAQAAWYPALLNEAWSEQAYPHAVRATGMSTAGRRQHRVSPGRNCINVQNSQYLSTSDSIKSFSLPSVLSSISPTTSFVPFFTQAVMSMCNIPLTLTPRSS